MSEHRGTVAVAVVAAVVSVMFGYAVYLNHNTARQATRAAHEARAAAASAQNEARAGLLVICQLLRGQIAVLHARRDLPRIDHGVLTADRVTYAELRCHGVPPLNLKHGHPFGTPPTSSHPAPPVTATTPRSTSAPGATVTAPTSSGSTPSRTAHTSRPARTSRPPPSRSSAPPRSPTPSPSLCVSALVSACLP